jgi:four helix bundle protein
MEETKGFRKLEVWKLADELTYMIYKVTKTFPKHELFGIVSQMRRAAISVPANIAEGYTHYSSKEKKRFYEIANCSLAELEYYIYFTYERLNYIDYKEFNELTKIRIDIGKMLNGLIKSMRSRIC